MTKTTRQQRLAIKRLYDRTQTSLTYRTFRAQVQPTFGMDSAVIINWAGMWLCIETDGYAHT